MAEAESAADQENSDATFTLDTVIVNFWNSLEHRFLTDYIGQNIAELFRESNIDAFPEFFISNYKHKIANKLIE